MQFASVEFITLLLLAIPLVAAVSSVVIKQPNLREGITLTLATVCFVNVANLFFLAVRGLAGPVRVATFENGLSIEFLVDPLGVIFALVASGLWLVSTVYSIGYLRANAEQNQDRFYSFFALSIFATLGIAMAGNLLTLFLCYEALTLATYPLVTHHGTAEARRAGRVYIATLLGTSLAFFVVAIVWTWLIAGTLDFTVGGILKDKCPPHIAGILLLLFVFGSAKAALMPLHRWLPAAMVAPAPVSALLHAVAVVKAGVFTIVKIIVYVFGTENLKGLIAQDWWAGGWLPYVAGITIILASIAALRQDNLKLRLAYSTVSQLGYVVMAVSLLSSFAVVAASFHIVAHALGKITLFFAAGAIYTVTHKTKVSELNGIGHTMPWTMAAFALASLSMIGVPPLAGFVSKVYLLMGIFETRHWFALGVVIISTLLNAAYFMPILWRAYKKPAAKGAVVKEAPTLMVVAMVLTAGASVLLFLMPDIFLWLASLLVE
jgi:multicomponent Na+:H+ antiporter subunit D